MPVKVIIDVRVQPALVDGYIDRLRQAMVTTRAFAGCLEADLFRDQEDPSHLAVVELWNSREDQARYFAWRAASGGMPEGTYSHPLKFAFYDPVSI